jgi:hypothetical protein
MQGQSTMRRWMSLSLFALSGIIVSGIVTVALSAAGYEPGWTGHVIVPQAEEAVRQATPIVERPYRPLHFYGNTIRRRYYHGRIRPTAPEVRQGFQAWANRN